MYIQVVDNFIHDKVLTPLLFLIKRTRGGFPQTRHGKYGHIFPCIYHAGQPAASRHEWCRCTDLVKGHACRTTDVHTSVCLYTGHNGTQCCCSYCREYCSDSTSLRLHYCHCSNSHREGSHPVTALYAAARCFSHIGIHRCYHI
jgi:hypothetical protein